MKKKSKNETFLKKKQMKKMPNVQLNHAKHSAMHHELKTNMHRDIWHHSMFLLALVAAGLILFGGLFLYLTNFNSNILPKSSVDIQFNVPASAGKGQIVPIECIANGDIGSARVEIILPSGVSYSLGDQFWEGSLVGAAISIKQAVSIDQSGEHILTCRVTSDKKIIEKEATIVAN